MPRWPPFQSFQFCVAALTLVAAREGRMALSLTSSAFQEGDAIPTRHTCDGADVSPALSWRGAPSELGGAVQGKNDFRRLGYGGPCPPPGPAHRYFFKLYALATKLGLKPGATKSDVERAMNGHVLATAQLMGRYARPRR